MKSITSRDNPSFKALLRLATDARECRRQRRTLIDGPHLVAAYRQQVGQPEFLLASESGSRHAEVRGLLEAPVDARGGCETMVLKDSLFKLLSGVDSPVGIAAVIAVPGQVPPFTGGSCVLLDAVQDAGNVGSILRSSAAAGIRDIFLGTGCASVWSPRVMRAAQGAHFRLRIREQVALDPFLRSYRGKSYATVVAGGMGLSSIPAAGDIAWLFGNEGQGVDPAFTALATAAVTIPMAAETESLNVAAAAAICLFSRVKSVIS